MPTRTDNNGKVKSFSRETKSRVFRYLDLDRAGSRLSINLLTYLNVISYLFFWHYLYALILFLFIIVIINPCTRSYENGRIAAMRERERERERERKRKREKKRVSLMLFR